MHKKCYLPISNLYWLSLTWETTSKKKTGIKAVHFWPKTFFLFCLWPINLCTKSFIRCFSNWKNQHIYIWIHKHPAKLSQYLKKKRKKKVRWFYFFFEFTAFILFYGQNKICSNSNFKCKNVICLLLWYLDVYVTS